MDEQAAFLRALTRERFRAVPETPGPVDGPTRRWLEAQQRRHVLDKTMAQHEAMTQSVIEIPRRNAG